MNPFPPTPGPVDPDAAAQRANVLLESEINARLDAVRELARRQNALDAALADYESAWQLASRTGWTEPTLRDIGLRAPEALSERPSRRAAEAPAARPEPEPASVPTSSPTLAPVVSLPSAANASAAVVAPAAPATPAAPAPLTPAAAFSPGAPGLGPAPTLP